MLGAGLGLVMPWTPIAYTWIALMVAGLALWFAARDLGSSSRAATLAAVLYMANPYMLFTAYERTAYAELLAAVWIPLLLAGALRERLTVLRIAVPLALLWLTNAPAAVMGCYALALIAAVRIVAAAIAKQGQSLRLAGRFFAGTLLGLGLGAFYIVPAAWERHWVQISMVVVDGMHFSNNFLFHHMGDDEHDQVLHTASVVAVEMIAITAIALIVAFLFTTRKRRTSEELGPLAILSLVIVFLLTPLSMPFWNHGPDLAFLQFPWRLLAILAVVFGLGLAKSLSAKPSAFEQTSAMVVSGTVALAVAWAMIVSSYGVFRQPCEPGVSLMPSGDIPFEESWWRAYRRIHPNNCQQRIVSSG